MMQRLLRRIRHYWFACIDHICSKWYKLFLGRVGARTVIRRHCRLEGDCLNMVSLGEDCVFDTNCVIGCRSAVVNKGQIIKPSITIGNRCDFGQYNHISAINRVEIGDNLLTGRFVIITDNSHGSVSMDELHSHPLDRKLSSKGAVVIGNNVWLCDKVSVLPGVSIGDGCVVGANSVVTHDIPSYCVAAGNPARVIKQLNNSQ